MPTVIRLLLCAAALLASFQCARCQFAPPFRFDGFPPPEPSTRSTAGSEPPTEPAATNGSTSGLIWQPLRATFRPLNRPVSTSPAPPAAPPVPLALSLGTEPIASVSSSSSVPSDSSADLSTTGLASDLTNTGTVGQPTPAPANSRDLLDSEDQPTRLPLQRFRPTKAPSSDPPTNQPPATSPSAAASRSQNLTLSTSASNRRSPARHITSECLECICEAATNCNPNSRCQTSDVRHTRCGMFLISYDQWLETGLSRELVTPEALVADAAADERAFYECVTSRECAERLLAIYAQAHAKDCDRDGRVDCYDVAAIHQGGMDGCASESLLDSQYWSDFNACFGFGR